MFFNILLLFLPLASRARRREQVARYLPTLPYTAKFFCRKSLSERSDGGVIYDNFATSHLIAQKVPSDRT